MGDLESYQQTASGAECSDSGGSSLPPSPKPAVMWAGSRRKISDSLLVPSRSRPMSRLRAQHSCPESTCTHNCKVQDGQTHTHPPLLHSSTVYYPPLAHQSSVAAAPSTVTPALPANHASWHSHSEQLELLNQKLVAAEEVNVIHSFHWHVQNAMIPGRSQELLPFLSVMYFFLPPFSTNYSSLLSHLILPSISWSTSQSSCSQIHI